MSPVLFTSNHREIVRSARYDTTVAEIIREGLTPPSGVVGVWYGMLGMYGVYGRSGMACLESMVCLVCMVGMLCMA